MINLSAHHGSLIPGAELLLSELRAADLLDFSRAAVDSSHIRAMKGVAGHRSVPGGPGQGRR